MEGTKFLSCEDLLANIDKISYLKSFWCDQNRKYRNHMEDKSIMSKIGDDIYLFGVLDGHGGKNCVKHFSVEIPNILSKKLENVDPFDDKKICDIVKSVFIEEDEKWYEKRIDNSGTTFTGILLFENKRIYTINLGDSRTILVEKDKFYSTKDHKPNSERERIANANGIIFAGRVDGFLAISRAFGDNSLKRDMFKVEYKGKNSKVSPEPDVVSHPFTSYKILIASDGLFDVVKNEELTAFVREGISIFSAKEIVELAIKKKSRDNISVMLLEIN